MSRLCARDAFLLLVLASLWGSAFLLIKIAVASIPPDLAAAGRVGVALGVVLLTLALSRRSILLPLEYWKRLFLLGLFGIAIPFYLQNVAETRIPSSHAAILMGTAPLFTIVLAHFTTDERLRPRVAIGFLMAFFGVAVLVGPNALAPGLRFGLFHILILFAAMSYAVNLILSRRIVDIPVETMTFGSLAWGTLLLLALISTGQTTSLETPSVASVLSVALLGIGSTASAAFLTMYMVRRAGTQPVALSVNLVPVIGVLLGAVVLKEYPGAVEVGAIALILSGLYVAAYAPLERSG